MSKPPRCLVRAAGRTALPPFSHPLNPSSQIHFTPLSDAAGLERVGVHLLRIPPGKESFVYHLHYTEEEYIYILSGRGIAEIGDEEHEVGPGDFLGFATPSVAHHLRNPFDEDLVYLAGGERRSSEIAEFPRHGKRMVRVGLATAIHDLATGAEYPGLPPLTTGNATMPPPGVVEGPEDVGAPVVEPAR